MCPSHRCLPRSPPPSFPPPVCTPLILSAQTPPLGPPSCRVHPVSAPSPFSRKRGCKWGSAHPPPAHAQSSAPSCPALSRPTPCPATPHPLRPALPPFCAHARGAGGTVRHPPPFCSPAAVPSAWAAPDLACMPSTPFARMLGAGRTERPLSLSVRRLLPRLMRCPLRARAPSTLCANVGGGTGGIVHTSPSVRPSTRAAPDPACTPSTPFTHALGARWTERPPPLSHSRAGLSAWAAPPLPPGLHATCHARALPCPCVNPGEGQEVQCAPTLPFVPQPGLCSPGYDAPCPPPPRLRLSPLRLRAPPPPHVLLHAFQKCRRDWDARKGRAVQRVPCAKGPRARGGPHARGPRVRGGGTERWVVQPRQRRVETRRVCKWGDAQPRRGALHTSGAGVQI